VVDRTFAWFNRNRRFAKDFEHTLRSATAFLYAAALSRAITLPAPLPILVSAGTAMFAIELAGALAF
jgi:hypothetical protein